ncbi:Alanine racemase [Candidatus Sulfobium mesophilum]|uniref:Alanine racemase n=1 Tax=Candidatus Sulfobium mesophilum TaxID=2016548 RepID=A0A2U3QK56_9BACT|nr:Alanine racemase [Candidatus Sulfobium mesophilum]
MTKEAGKRSRVNRGPLAEIDLSALQHNLKIVRKISEERPVIAVVKADAYGHGSVEIARNLARLGVSHFAVAYTGEAKVLRESGITADIIVLFDRSDVEDYFTYGLVPVVQDKETARKFSVEAVKRSKSIRVHLKVDTGMGRLGFRPEQTVSAALEIAGWEGIKLEGLMSHFSEADLADRSYASHQLNLFNEIRFAISGGLGRPIISHIANSAAVLSLKDAMMDAVRPGLLLYGISPFREGFGLMPLMTLKTSVLAVRDLCAGTPVSYGRTFITKCDSRIAVIPVGYADGYSRLYSNNSEMLVRGRRVPVAGRVCMDVTMLDVTSIGGVCEGEEVVILGKQGNEQITAAELAARIGTIPYEILTSLGGRARREYVNGH